ncbi:hypothetical protein [Deinococcus sp. KSM4-11]|nr:hypothetical protein [Deinococcus sp. KSM4-11]
MTAGHTCLDDEGDVHREIATRTLANGDKIIEAAKGGVILDAVVHHP